MWRLQLQRRGGDDQRRQDGRIKAVKVDIHLFMTLLLLDRASGRISVRQRAVTPPLRWA